MITNQEILRKYGFKALPFKNSEQKSYFVKKKKTIINEMTILSNIFFIIHNYHLGSIIHFKYDTFYSSWSNSQYNLTKNSIMFNFLHYLTMIILP